MSTKERKLARNEGYHKQISTIVPLFGISVHANPSVKLKIKKHCLRIILDDYTSDYEKLFKKGKTSTMNVKMMAILATEIFKTVNNLNPFFMKDIFISKFNPKIRPNNLIVKKHNRTKYGTKSLL